MMTMEGDHPTICALLDTPPRFFIPRLDDKPQNPIMDTLRLLNKESNAQPTMPKASSLLPLEYRSLSEDLPEFEQTQLENRREQLWQLAASRMPGNMVRSENASVIHNLKGTQGSIEPGLVLGCSPPIP